MSDYTPSDLSWSLIRDAATGNGPARSLFARAYVPVVREFFRARWPSRHQDVEDAVQDTFVECFRSEGILERAASEVRDFRAYIHGVIRKVAQRYESRRFAKAADRIELDEEEIVAREARLSKVFDRGWAETIMRLASDLMTTRAHAGGAAARLRIELLRLRFEQGLPIRDIAAEWEMDPDAVHRAYAKARAEFHSCLRKVVREQAVRTEEDLDAECRRLIALLGGDPA